MRPTEEQTEMALDAAERMWARGLDPHHLARVLRYLHERVSAGHSMLIVDDVYSSGSSVNAVIDQLGRKARRNLPGDIRVATVWYRPTDRTIEPPDFYIHETADWLVLPYELSGLSLDEIRDEKEEMKHVVDRLEALVRSGKGKTAA